MSAGLLERNRRIEYGDFQTPPDLASAVCRALRAERPATLIEPTCGTGSFLAAGLSSFPRLRFVLGVDIDNRYAAMARRIAARTQTTAQCRIRVGDFFQIDWPGALAEYPEPLLVLGNPPWVTNSTLGVLRGGNLPPKQNLPGRSGLEALTGKSNFDVSEWMIFRLLEATVGRRATLAMLCKTAVARRVLARAWETKLSLHSCEIRSIDALRHFGARVDACLLVCRSRGVGPATASDCRVFDGLESSHSSRAFGWRDGRLVADIAAYEWVKHLLTDAARFAHADGRRPLTPGPSPARGEGRRFARNAISCKSRQSRYSSPLSPCGRGAGGEGAFDCPKERQDRWRSGIKHDCAAVFEFREENGRLVNGLGETVDLEDCCLYPLVKSSDLAAMRGRLSPSPIPPARRWRGQPATSSVESGEGSFSIARHLLVPQKRVGQETESIAERAPKTWRYLQQRAERLDRRASRVYEKQPRFSIFGVGPYTFAAWKVVVSGFYKTPTFVAVGPVGGRPVVCDDTCYFLPCRTRAEARDLARRLNGRLARDFFSAFVFRDAKRPLTAELLNSLNLSALTPERGA